MSFARRLQLDKLELDHSRKTEPAKKQSPCFFCTSRAPIHAGSAQVSLCNAKKQSLCIYLRLHFRGFNHGSTFEYVRSAQDRKRVFFKGLGVSNETYLHKLQVSVYKGQIMCGKLQTFGHPQRRHLDLAQVTKLGTRCSMLPHILELGALRVPSRNVSCGRNRASMTNTSRKGMGASMSLPSQ